MNQTEGKSGPSTSKYQRLAETVGMIPSFNLEDNLYQGRFVGQVTLTTGLVGLVLGGAGLGMIFALLGLIGSGFLSGFVLMIVGLKRVAHRESPE